jgi:predicted hydrocarbon binding protein
MVLGRVRLSVGGEVYTFRVKDSFLAKSFANSGLNKGVCFMLSGFFSGMARAYAELLDETIKYKCEETRCQADGSPYCEFKLYRT